MELLIVGIPCILLGRVGNRERFRGLVEGEQDIPRPVGVIDRTPVVDGAFVGTAICLSYTDRQSPGRLSDGPAVGQHVPLI